MNLHLKDKYLNTDKLKKAHQNGAVLLVLQKDVLGYTSYCSVEMLQLLSYVRSKLLQ